MWRSAELEKELQSAQVLIDQSNPSLSEARSLNTELGNVQMNLLRKVQEIRERYQSPDSSQQEEIHLHWQALIGSTRIRSQDELDQDAR